MKQKNIKGLISEYFIFLIFIALVVVLTCLKPSFIAPTNLVNILKQASINGILAFGMMFVIIAGGFDMSVGSTVAFTGILAALLGKGDLPLIVPLVVAMLAGLAVGMVNGIGVAIGDLPPFIMTLGSMTAVRGLALLTSNGKPITGISKEYKAVAASSIAGIPMLSVFLVIVIIICAFVLSKTVYGRRVYACGGNLQAARVSGINTTAIRISTFAIAGLLAGLCGFLMTSRVTIGQPTAAESYEMDRRRGQAVGRCHWLSAHHRYCKWSGHYGRIVPLAEDRQGRYHCGSCPDRRKGKDQEKLIFADKEAAGVLRALLSSSSYSQRL